jgi:ATP-dependent DNA ligase
LKITCQGRQEFVIVGFTQQRDRADELSALLLAVADDGGRLAELGLESFALLTGGKGVHIVAPLAPRRDWAAVRSRLRSPGRSSGARLPIASRW